MSSLGSVRKDVGRALAECTVGQVDSATTTSIVDADLLDPVETESLYEGAWILLTEGSNSGQERRILSYVPSSGTLTLSRAFTYEPEAATEYEIHRLIRPSELNRLISEAVTPLYYMSGYEIAITDPNDRLIAMPFASAPGLIVSVENRGAYTDISESRLYPVIWKAYWSEAGAVTIEIEPGSVTDTSGYIVVKFLRQNGTVGETSNIRVPDNLAVCASLVKCYEWLMRSGPGQDVTRYERLLAYETKKLMTMMRRYSPRTSVLRVEPPPLVGWNP